MLSFTGRSLRGRMMLLAMLSSGIGLALVCTEFFIFDFRDFCVRKGRDLETTAHLLSADSSAALAFDDADRARQMLSALRAQQSIRAAVLYRRDGTSLAEYLRQDVARKFRSEEHTSELQSLRQFVCRLLLEKKKMSSPLEPIFGRAQAPAAFKAQFLHS